MSARSVASRIWIPAAAVGIVGLALLWTTGTIPRLPLVSEVIGLVAVFLAPGIAAERLLRGDRWAIFERIGLAATLSMALVALAGVALHVVNVRITPANVLLTVFLVILPLAAGSMLVELRGAAAGRRPSRSGARRFDIADRVAIGSMVLLVIGFVLVLVIAPAPRGPGLEVMIVDDQGRLAPMPIVVPRSGGVLTVLMRSQSGVNWSVQVRLEGGGVQQWSTSVNGLSEGWTTIGVPLSPAGGTEPSASLVVAGAADTLTLPIALRIAP